MRQLAQRRGQEGARVENSRRVEDSDRLFLALAGKLVLDAKEAGRDVRYML